ncbi:MAG TPA: SUMF1/EgtB/PvdO family nonheme iron enzyme [Nannocystis sp.]|jgi:hypothetical protein
MVRWVVVCAFASGLACTMSNPLFVVDEDPASGSTFDPSTTDPATGDPADPADPAQTTGTTGDGALPGTSTPDESSGDATSTSTEPATGDGTTATSSTDETTGTGEPGPCQDVCGTPGCGDCPDAGMVAYPGFSIGAREVSNAEYQQFLAAGQDPAIQPEQCAWNDDYTPTIWPAIDPALPVVNIDWCDARAYCAWAGKRLCGAIEGGPASPFDIVNPAKNQWYRACSNGDFRPYPYGKKYKKFACNGADALFGGLLGVGSLPLCEAPIAGVFDLSGNVWEWVDSCIGDGPDAECMRRGGSFYSDPDALRCDVLSTRPRSTAVHYVGLRCCSL